MKIGAEFFDTKKPLEREAAHWEICYVVLVSIDFQGDAVNIVVSIVVSLCPYDPIALATGCWRSRSIQRPLDQG